MIQKKSLKDAIQNPEIISVVGGLLDIDSLNVLRISSTDTPIGDATYKLVDKIINKSVYRVVYHEDRYNPYVFYVSLYYPSYKSEYRVNQILKGNSSSSLKFIYDSEGNIYFQKIGGTRGGRLAIQLISGLKASNIEKVDSVDGTEIPIS